MNIRIVRSLTLLTVLLGCTMLAGCSTYRVTTSDSMSEAEAILAINKHLNRSRAFRTWNDSLAGSDFFLDCSRNANGIRRKYSEIESVEFRGNCGMLLACGLCDPTLASNVVLHYKDTTESWFQRDPYGTYFAWIPFYLFRPSWGEVDRAAKGFECMRAKSERSGESTGK